MSCMLFAGGGGGTGLKSKKDGIGKAAPGPSAGSPGISMSRPALMKATLCTAPQSEVTKPLKPIWSRRIVVRVSLLPQAKVPLTRLYEHMIDDTPALTAASKGAT